MGLHAPNGSRVALSQNYVQSESHYGRRYVRLVRDRASVDRRWTDRVSAGITAARWSDQRYFGHGIWDDPVLE